MMPGPTTPKMPKLSVTTRAGAGAVLELPFCPTTETAPSGAFEGIMALIWLGLTNTGIAATVVAPWVTWTETPPKLVDSGKARPGLEPGPIRAPKMVNKDPRAMEPAGRPGGMKLAALTIPRP